MNANDYTTDPGFPHMKAGSTSPTPTYDAFYKETMEQAKTLRKLSCGCTLNIKDSTELTCAANKLEYFAQSSTDKANLNTVRIERDEAVKDVESFKANNRYQRGYGDGEKQAQQTIDQLKKELEFISLNHCGVKVEGEITHADVYAFVEGQIDKQSDRADKVEAQLAAAKAALEKIRRFPVHSEPVGCAYEMQDIAHEALAEWERVRKEIGL